MRCSESRILSAWGCGTSSVCGAVVSESGLRPDEAVRLWSGSKDLLTGGSQEEPVSQKVVDCHLLECARPGICKKLSPTLLLELAGQAVVQQYSASQGRIERIINAGTSCLCLEAKLRSSWFPAFAIPRAARPGKASVTCLIATSRRKAPPTFSITQLFNSETVACWMTFKPFCWVDTDRGILTAPALLRLYRTGTYFWKPHLSISMWPLPI